MKHAIKIYGPAALAVLAAFVVAYQFIKPAPPDHVRIASGSTDGAYYAFAQAYARELAKEGVRLEVLSTSGSVENIRLLHAGKVDAALVQGGIPDAGQGERLHSLGSLYYEPLWVFVRRDLSLSDLRALQGLRVGIGSEGSGTHALAARLLADNGIGADNAQLQAIAGAEAAERLQKGGLDAAFFVASPRSPLIQSLLRAQGLRLFSFRRAEAYARRYRFLSGVTLPQGVVDLQRNLPPEDVRLLAPAANMVVSGEMHPAIAELLLQAMASVHRDGDWFSGPGEFPQAGLLAYPLADEAARYYKNGPPFLQRYLPFWAASLVDRLKVMLLPLVLMMLPLFKVLPPIYNWRMGARIYRWYDELEALEEAVVATPATERAALAARLDRIEDGVRRVRVPASYGRQLYHLRQHIQLVRSRLQA